VVCLIAVLDFCSHGTTNEYFRMGRDLYMCIALGNSVVTMVEWLLRLASHSNCSERSNSGTRPAMSLVFTSTNFGQASKISSHRRFSVECTNAAGATLCSIHEGS